MAIKWKLGLRGFMLSSDSKPSAGTSPDYTELLETNTRKTWIEESGVWIPKFPRLQGTQVWRDPETSTYYAQNGAGKVLASSSSAQTVVQTALDAQGFVRIHSGEYQSTATWNLSSDTYVQLMPNTLVSVPNGATHAIWRLYSGQATNVKRNTTIDGGRYLEAGVTPARNWTIVLMDTDNTGGGNDDGGIVGCTIKNIYTKYCGKMIHLKTTGVVQGGFINDNTFENCWADYSRYGVFFESAAQPILASGTHNNTFYRIVCQDDIPQNYPLIVAFKDIGGWNNTFIGCNVWDIDPTTSTAIPCNLLAATANNTGAHNTNFIGCDMFRVPIDWEIVQDKGDHTTIVGGINTGGGYFGYMPDPFIKKVGMWMAAGTTGSNSFGVGLLYQFAITGGTLSRVMDANGHAARLDTGSTSGTQSGLNGVLITARGFNPFFKMKIKINQLTDTRFFFGFCSGASPPVLTADDPLNGISGFGIGYSTTSGVSPTTYLKYTNDGTTTTETANTGITVTTNPITLYVAAFDSLSGFKLRIGTNDAGVLHTSGVPTQYTQLRPYVGICNTSANAKTMDAYMAYLKQDGV